MPEEDSSNFEAPESPAEPSSKAKRRDLESRPAEGKSAGQVFLTIVVVLLLIVAVLFGLVAWACGGGCLGTP